MSEIGQAIQRNVVRTGFAGVMTLGALAPPAAAAVVGFERPVHVEFAPGVGAETTIIPSDTSDVNLGAAGGGTFPKFHVKPPYISWLTGDLAGYMDVDPITVSANKIPSSEQLGLYTALLKNPSKTIAKPVLKAAKANATRNAWDVTATELLALEGAALGYQRRRRHHHKYQAGTQTAIGAHQKVLYEALDHVGDQLLRAHARHTLTWVEHALDKERSHTDHPKRWSKIAAGVALATTAVSGMVAFDAVNGAAHRPPAAAAESTALSSTLIKLDPKDLAGAKLFGTGATYAINIGSQKLLKEKQHIDGKEDYIDDQVTQQVNALRDKGQLPYVDDPNYEVALRVSDIHCNMAYESHVLPTTLHAFDVDEVEDTGDQVASAGYLPFQSQCIDTMTDALKPTADYRKNPQVIFVSGNHDGPDTDKQMKDTVLTNLAGQKYHPYLLLDDPNGSVITLGSETYVGVPDSGRKSVIGYEITPNGVAGEKVLATEGIKLAGIACKVLQQTGQAPIAMVHEPPAGNAVLNRGCAQEVKIGHTHQLYPEQGYTSPANGAFEIRSIDGTASGAAEGDFTLYSSPGGEATEIVDIYDRQTHQEVGTYTIVTEPGTLKTTVSHFQPTTVKSTLPVSTVDTFLQQFDPADTSQALISQNQSNQNANSGSRRQAHVHHHKSLQIAQQPGHAAGRRD